jgi:hypothetical protein
MTDVAASAQGANDESDALMAGSPTTVRDSVLSVPAGGRAFYAAANVTVRDSELHAPQVFAGAGLSTTLVANTLIDNFGVDDPAVAAGSSFMCVFDFTPEYTATSNACA